MKKGIGLLAVLVMLAVIASCDYSSHDKTILGPLAAKEKITARPATFDTSVTSETWTTYSTADLYSDDMDVEADDTPSYRGKGIVDWITIAYANFNSSGEDLTYSSIGGGLSSYGFLHILNGNQGQPYTEHTTGVVMEDADHEMKYPVQNMVGGLDVSRKLYVNPWGSVFTKDDFVRWLEILTNNTGSPITVDVVIGGYMYEGNQVRASSDGDGVAEAEDDNWFIMDDYSIWTSSQILVGILMDGSMGYSEVDNIVAATSTGTVLNFWATGWTTSAYDTSTMTMTPGSQSVLFTWTGVTLNPGETKILMHLANLTPQYVNLWSKGAPDAIEGAQMLDSAPPEVVASMDADEINAVVNWPAARKNCNITGPEKSVAAGVLVTALNETALTTAQSYSLPDGSFGICLDAAEGDMIKLTVDGKLVRRVKVTEE